MASALSYYQSYTKPSAVVSTTPSAPMQTATRTFSVFGSKSQEQQREKPKEETVTVISPKGTVIYKGPASLASPEVKAAMAENKAKEGVPAEPFKPIPASEISGTPAEQVRFYGNAPGKQVATPSFLQGAKLIGERGAGPATKRFDFLNKEGTQVITTDIYGRSMGSASASTLQVSEGITEYRYPKQTFDLSARSEVSQNPLVQNRNMAGSEPSKIPGLERPKYEGKSYSEAVMAEQESKRMGLEYPADRTHFLYLPPSAEFQLRERYANMPKIDSERLESFFIPKVPFDTSVNPQNYFQTNKTGYDAIFDRALKVPAYTLATVRTFPYAYAKGIYGFGVAASNVPKAISEFVPSMVETYKGVFETRTLNPLLVGAEFKGFGKGVSVAAAGVKTIGKVPVISSALKSGGALVGKVIDATPLKSEIITTSKVNVEVLRRDLGTPAVIETFKTSAIIPRSFSVSKTAGSFGEVTVRPETLKTLDVQKTLIRPEVSPKVVAETTIFTTSRFVPTRIPFIQNLLSRETATLTSGTLTSYPKLYKAFNEEFFVFKGIQANPRSYFTNPTLKYFEEGIKGTKRKIFEKIRMPLDITPITSYGIGRAVEKETLGFGIEKGFETVSKSGKETILITGKDVLDVEKPLSSVLPSAKLSGTKFLEIQSAGDVYNVVKVSGKNYLGKEITTVKRERIGSATFQYKDYTKYYDLKDALSGEKLVEKPVLKDSFEFSLPERAKVSLSDRAPMFDDAIMAKLERQAVEAEVKQIKESTPYVGTEYARATERTGGMGGNLNAQVMAQREASLVRGAIPAEALKPSSGYSFSLPSEYAPSLASVSAFKPSGGLASVSEGYNVLATPSLSKSIARDVSRDISREASKLGLREVSRSVAREATRDLNRFQAREISRQTSKEISREVNKEVSRELNREVNKEVSRELNREVSRQVNRQVNRQINRQISRQVTRNVSRDVLIMANRPISRPVIPKRSVKLGSVMKLKIKRGIKTPLADLVYKTQQEIQTLERASSPSEKIARKYFYKGERIPTFEMLKAKK